MKLIINIVCTIVIAAIIAVPIWACCKASGDADDAAERVREVN